MALGSNARARQRPNVKRPRQDERQAAIDKPWVLWARIQRYMGQFLLGILSVAALLVTVIIYQGHTIVSQNRTIEQLSSERIMIGMPQPDGTFVSVAERPKEMIRDYADTFVRNLYNYDPESVERNFMRVLAMYDHHQRRDIQPQLERIRAEVIEDGLNQLYTPHQHRTVTTDGGYEYQTRGIIYEYGGEMLVREREVEITIKVDRQPPTESDPLGVAVTSVREETL